MKKKSTKKNFIYNLIFTMVNMIFPLITAPYLSNVLGAENIGKVNYATSIINWFILFASFGIPRYGIREISRNRDNKKKLSMAFWNLIFIQFILSLIIIVIYIVMIFSMKRFQNDITLYLLMASMIILNIFSIDWFYQGIEEYAYITTRNIIFKVLSIILIFLMIKSRENYLLYATINIFGLSFNNIMNYLNSKKYINKKIYKFRTGYYLKELKVYFMTTFIIAIYTSIDQLMLGSYSEKDLAYYVRSKTIQGVGVSITNSIVTVFIPRTAYLIEKNYDEYKKMIQESINYIYILAMPCIFGICLLSKQIMILLGGNEFIPATSSLVIISVLILINSIGGWQINQILIPHKLENYALRFQSLGAIISFSLNLILIKKYSYNGAAITWVITETFLAIVVSIFIKKSCKKLKIKYFSKGFFKYLISSIIMSVFIIIIKSIFNNYIIQIIVSVFIGAIIYFIVLYILKDEVVLDLFSNIKRRLKI